MASSSSSVEREGQEGKREATMTPERSPADNVAALVAIEVTRLHWMGKVFKRGPLDTTGLRTVEEMEEAVKEFERELEYEPSELAQAYWKLKEAFGDKLNNPRELCDAIHDCSTNIFDENHSVKRKALANGWDEDAVYEIFDLRFHGVWKWDSIHAWVFKDRLDLVYTYTEKEKEEELLSAFKTFVRLHPALQQLVQSKRLKSE
jgi:hypothetical protein